MVLFENIEIGEYKGENLCRQPRQQIDVNQDRNLDDRIDMQISHR